MKLAGWRIEFARIPCTRRLQRCGIYTAELTPDQALAAMRGNWAEDPGYLADTKPVMDGWCLRLTGGWVLMAHPASRWRGPSFNTISAPMP